MNINIRWFDDTRTIILCELLTNWTWNDLYQVGRVVDQMVGDSGRRVVMLVSFERARSFPKRISLAPLRGLLIERQPHSRIVILYGLKNASDRVFARTVIVSLGRTRVPLVIADSLDEALRLAKQEAEEDAPT